MPNRNSKTKSPVSNEGLSIIRKLRNKNYKETKLKLWPEQNYKNKQKAPFVNIRKTKWNQRQCLIKPFILTESCLPFWQVFLLL